MAAKSDGDPLPVWRTVREAYALTFRQLAAAGRISWAWLIALTLSVALTSWFFWPSHEAALDAGAATSWVQFVTAGMTATAGASIAVAWHTLVLQGKAPDARRYLRLDGVVWRYLVVGLAILAPFGLAAFLIPEMDTETEAETRLVVVYGIASLSVFATAVVLAVKSSLLLPAIALGRRDVTLDAAWKATKGNWWRLFVGGLLAVAPPQLLLSLPVLLSSTATSEEAPAETQLDFVLSSTQNELATLIGSIFALSFLSLAFRHFFPDGGSVASSDAEPVKAGPGKQKEAQR